jgi:hypothetical protein
MVQASEPSPLTVTAYLLRIVDLLACAMKAPLTNRVIPSFTLLVLSLPQVQLLSLAQWDRPQAECPCHVGWFR